MINFSHSILHTQLIILNIFISVYISIDYFGIYFYMFLFIIDRELYTEL